MTGHYNPAFDNLTPQERAAFRAKRAENTAAYQAQAKSIALHELHHLFASGVAAVALGVSGESYAKAQVHIHVSRTGLSGECGIIWPDTVKVAAQKEIAYLAAHGPLVSHYDDAIEAMKAGDISEVAAKSNLSSRDLELIAAFDGAPTFAMSALIAVKHIHDLLGHEKRQKLVSVVRQGSKQPEMYYALPDLLPHNVAIEAASIGRATVAKALDTGNTVLDRIVQRTAAEKAVAEGKRHA